MPKITSEAWSHLSWNDRSARRFHSKLLLLLVAMLLVATALTTAQEQTAQGLAEQSAIIVRGKVLKINASDEPMLAASRSTAVISVEEMYQGQEIAGEQRERTATVILKRPDSVKVGEEAVFFGNPRFMGRSLTITDEGEIAGKAIATAVPSEWGAGAQMRKDKPIVDRLATASLVFRGTVDSVQPLEASPEEARKTPAPPSEHDPEWQVANVRVDTPIKGGEAGKIVAIAFPASRDIVWFNAPKLKVGQEAVFIAHAPSEQGRTVSENRAFAALQAKQPVYAVTEPFDVLPATEENHVRGLLTSSKETKQ